jgi:molybdate transport system regulatory protein
VTGRAPVVTDTDVALLRALGRTASVVAASRSVGISRDRAVYRLGRLEDAFGGPVASGARGGRAHGGSVLTSLGDRIAREGFDAVELLRDRPVATPVRSNRLDGTYRRSPAPTVEVGPGLRLRVAFAAADGEAVRVLIDPESILVARRRFPSSARNVLPGAVEGLAPSAGPGDAVLIVRSGAAALRVALTPETVREMHLRRGARVWLYVKATAIRRVAPPTPGSPRRSARRPPRPRAGSASR